jgi:hypothetical protein
MKGRARTLVIAALTSLVMATTVGAWQNATAKERKIRKLLEVTGAGDLGKQVMDKMLDAFRGSPNLPDGFIDRFKADVHPQEVVELVVPIYGKYLSEEDLDGILAFYETPAGKNLLQAQPKILKESMEAGQRWGQEVAQRVLDSLKSKKKD